MMNQFSCESAELQTDRQTDTHTLTNTGLILLPRLLMWEVITKLALGSGGHNTFSPVAGTGLLFCHSCNSLVISGVIRIRIPLQYLVYTVRGLSLQVITANFCSMTVPYTALLGSNTVFIARLFVANCLVNQVISPLFALFLLNKPDRTQMVGDPTFCM